MMELTIVSAIKEAQAMFGGSSGAPGEESEPDEFFECQDAPAEFARTGSGQDPTISEVEALLEKLLHAYPELSDRDFLHKAGFPPRAITAVMAKV